MFYLLLLLLVNSIYSIIYSIPKPPILTRSQRNGIESYAVPRRWLSFVRFIDEKYLKKKYAKLLICAYKLKATNSLIRLLTNLKEEEINFIRNEIKDDIIYMDADNPLYEQRKPYILRQRVSCAQKCYALSLLRKKLDRNIYHIISETSFYEPIDDILGDHDDGTSSTESKDNFRFVSVKPSFLRKYFYFFKRKPNLDNSLISFQEYFILYVMPYLNDRELKMSAMANKNPELFISNLNFGQNFIKTEGGKILLARVNKVDLGSITLEELLENINLFYAISLASIYNALTPEFISYDANVDLDVVLDFLNNNKFASKLKYDKVKPSKLMHALVDTVKILRITNISTKILADFTGLDKLVLDRLLGVYKNRNSSPNKGYFEIHFRSWFIKNLVCDVNFICENLSSMAMFHRIPFSFVAHVYNNFYPKLITVSTDVSTYELVLDRSDYTCISRYFETFENNPNTPYITTDTIWKLIERIELHLTWFKKIYYEIEPGFIALSRFSLELLGETLDDKLTLINLYDYIKYHSQELKPFSIIYGELNKSYEIKKISDLLFRIHQTLV